MDKREQIENAVTTAPIPATEPADVALSSGVLASQQLREAVGREWIVGGEWRIPTESIQPASLDLRLGEFAWALRCSFLPDSNSTVEEKIEDLAFQKIDLRDGATLERDRPYLVPLIEELHLPPEIRAKANPKSSTGRLDVFTRLIADHSDMFDSVPGGYQGRIYTEISPCSFSIRVRKGSKLNQIRFRRRNSAQAETAKFALSDRDLLEAHGYQTSGTSNGFEALDLVRKLRPDLVLMDIQLPQVSGLEVTRWIKDDPELRSIPVVAVTAFAMKGDEERIREGGCEAYLSKPISVGKFIETVRRFIG